MREVTLQQLTELNAEQWSDPSKPAIAVLLGSSECPHCSGFRSLLDSIEADLLSRDIELLYLEIDERPPLFAPNALPSLVCFYRGVRLWEGIGQVDDARVVKAALLFHVHGEVHEVE